MTYQIDEIEGIGPSYREKLATAGISNTNHLLDLCCSASGRKAIAGETGISEKLLLEWANMADLMRLRGVGGQFAELLEASGVDTIKELRTRNAENLALRMKEVNAEKKLAKSMPSRSMVTNWIAAAKTFEPLITH